MSGALTPGRDNEVIKFYQELSDIDIEIASFLTKQINIDKYKQREKYNELESIIRQLKLKRNALLVNIAKAR